MNCKIQDRPHNQKTDKKYPNCHIFLLYSKFIHQSQHLDLTKQFGHNDLNNSLTEVLSSIPVSPAALLLLPHFHPLTKNLRFPGSLSEYRSFTSAFHQIFSPVSSSYGEY